MTHKEGDESYQGPEPKTYSRIFFKVPLLLNLDKTQISSNDL